MKADTLRRYIDLIPNDFNLSNVVLSVIYAKKGCRVKYLPITFRPRQGGINSINMKKIFKIGRQALKDFRRINRVLNRIPEENSDLLAGMNTWPDYNPGDWFYLALQEATNSHAFQHKAGNYETWTGMNKKTDWTRYEH